MCVMCDIQNSDGRCDYLNMRVETQNAWAEQGLCESVMVHGFAVGSKRWVSIYGQMRRLANGQWIFEGRNPF